MAPFTSYGSYLRRLAGVLQSAADVDIDVMVFDHESAAVASSPVLASMPVHGRLDGLIVMGLGIDVDIARRLTERGLPTVAVDAESEVFSRIVIDDRAGGRTAARHLLECGYTRFGYMLERQIADYDSQAIKRLAGFREAIEDRTGTHLVVTTSDNSVAHARVAAAELLDRPDPPRAIMAHHDLLAVGILLAARDGGLRFPKDVAVLGFDDGEAAAAADLTTLRQPFEESGRAGLAVLLSHMNGSSLRSTTMLDVELVTRATT
jgi:LacI family transcriptional regulator